MKIHEMKIVCVKKYWLKFWYNWKIYSRNLTMHGSMYFSESKSFIELIFWLLVIILCFAMCIWLMLIHWFRYETKPTVTTIKTTAYPISNIQFPAVTVCNSNTVYRQNTYPIQNKLSGIDKNIIEEFFKDLKYLMSPTRIDTKKYKEVYNILSDMEYTPELLMRNFTQPCGELIKNCKYQGMNLGCQDIFKPKKTGYGICCGFDIHADLKSHSQQDASNDYLLGAGTAQGLMLTIDIDPQQYVSRIYPYYGAMIMVHHSLDFPDTSTFAASIQPGDFTLMQVTPTAFNADEESLNAMDVEKRSCWLNDEGHLISGSEYSFKNCILECKVKAIYDLCGCVPFYYPSIGANYSQCTLLDIICLKNNELIYHNFKLKMLEKNATKSIENETIYCDCLPECTDVTFNGYVNMAKNTYQGQFAVIQIYFQYAWCVEYMRNMNMTWDMLLASLGGIFGLCLGGSLISVIEMFYYFFKSLYKTFKPTNKINTTKLLIKSKEIKLKFSN